MELKNSQIQQPIYSVSKLTKEIKAILENKFPFIWISGEISNLSIPASGHCYFTLKDKNAQISAVMFRGQNRQLKFEIVDGMQMVGLGRISVYEPRGSYQLIFEFLEPKGVGALQFAFEQLKTRLADEGLFDAAHKKPLPFLPKKIVLITSPSGAVVHDMVQVLNRRFPGMDLLILPVKVQGEGAAEDVVAAIRLLNVIEHVDLAILARGGGSIEDLQAFNHESVARAIYEADIPIVSAIGHETDFTIADFVADLRAPTPSAAAELVVPLKYDLVRRVEMLSQRLRLYFHQDIDRKRFRVVQLERRLIDPRKKYQDFLLRLDELVGRLIRSIQGSQTLSRERLARRTERLGANNPAVRIERFYDQLRQINGKLFVSHRFNYNEKQRVLRELMAKLHALSPLAVLSRGYSITRTVPGEDIVKDARQVVSGQELEILIQKGSLRVSVLTPVPSVNDIQ
ncbi:MAG: exodeoxyribonuclease VII large subunit [Desulfobacterales bacterium]|jgi:exodeoxyribonuclease VII large subunit|nr:exodeoxyribonuclease VII large subunit [Desulfobacterales bacterium]